MLYERKQPPLWRQFLKTFEQTLQNTINWIPLAMKTSRHVIFSARSRYNKDQGSWIRNSWPKWFQLFNYTLKPSVVHSKLAQILSLQQSSQESFDVLTALFVKSISLRIHCRVIGWLVLEFSNVRSFRGTAVAKWLRCCATIRKVAGSIPAGVSGFFIVIIWTWGRLSL